MFGRQPAGWHSCQPKSISLRTSVADFLSVGRPIPPGDTKGRTYCPEARRVAVGQWYLGVERAGQALRSGGTPGQSRRSRSTRRG